VEQIQVAGTTIVPQGPTIIIILDILAQVHTQETALVHTVRQLTAVGAAPEVRGVGQEDIARYVINQTPIQAQQGNQ